MKFLRYLLLACCLGALPAIQTGCSSPPVTLAAGGAYSDANQFAVDKAVTDADSLLLSLIAWYDANKTFLARWPEVGVAAEKARTNEPAWARNAFAAGDAYVRAVNAYKAGAATADPANASQQRFSGAISLITDLTNELKAYQAAHPRPTTGYNPIDPMPIQWPDMNTEPVIHTNLVPHPHA